jgi:hypothetical protein
MHMIDRNIERRFFGVDSEEATGSNGSNRHLERLLCGHVVLHRSLPITVALLASGRPILLRQRRSGAV